VTKIYWSTDEENFNYESLEEAINDLYKPEVGHIVYSGEQKDFTPKLHWSIEHLLEHLGEQGYDEVGEHVGDWPDASKEAVKQLENYLKRWIKRHCPPKFYGVKNVKKYVITEEDLKCLQ
jgi:hypothetical protein